MILLNKIEVFNMMAAVDFNFLATALGILLAAAIISVIIGLLKNKQNPKKAILRWFTFAEEIDSDFFKWEKIEILNDKPLKLHQMGLEIAIFITGTATIIMGVEYFPITWRLFLSYPLLLLWLSVYQRGVLKEDFSKITLYLPKKPVQEHRWVQILTIALIFILILSILNVLIDFNPLVVRFPQKSTWVYIFYSCIQAPLVEELYFRGFFYSRVKEWNHFAKKLNRNYFILIEAFCSAVLFAFWHVFSFMIFYSAFFVGLFLCFLRNEWGESLVLGFVIHSMYNFIAMPWII
ncbi:lysostaphin resistance A-like protein [Candidatus Lokiarchaeum ossiferum]|uniref:lysostaphin resistance A-like protein n=1 Tax=Candidatus Lokiarchaeum ossiferum TaxID=2951803 RepID=UPI00352E06D7